MMVDKYFEITGVGIVFPEHIRLYRYFTVASRLIQSTVLSTLPIPATDGGVDVCPRSL